MSTDDDTLQLDLTESITEVPQANSISLFLELMECLRGEKRTIPAMASLLEVDKRTVRYYTDFGRWLQWIEPVDDTTVGLTREGRAFVTSEPARGRLFANALFARPLVRTVQRLKRDHFDDVDEPEATRQACFRAVERLTALSDATARRRAGALASMLRWAYQPDQLDWSTGRPTEEPTAPFDFQGQSFLTAYAARQFGESRSICIGFPRQVLTFATGDGDELETEHWQRASYETDDGTNRWFGSIPINPSTLGVARRGGPDLRRLLISCNPYLAMVVTLLTSSSPTGSPSTTLTSDMYGLRLWHRQRELGTPLEALARLAADLDLVPVETIPHLRDLPVDDDLHPADDADLATILVETGIARRVDTSLILAPGVGSELRLPVGDGPTLWERMEPLRDDLGDATRHHVAS